MELNLSVNKVLLFFVRTPIVHVNISYKDGFELLKCD